VFEDVIWPSNGNGLVQDSAGHLFVGGAFFNQIDLGLGALKVAGTTLLGPSYTNVFLAQLDPTTAKASWLQSYPGPAAQTQTVTSFAASGKGQIGMIGILGGGSLTVAGTDVAQVRPNDQFIIGASSADGSGLWGWRLNLQNASTATNGGVLRAIAGDPLGNSFLVCGNALCWTGTAPEGGIPPSPAKDFSPSLGCAGGVDVVLARVDVKKEVSDGGAAATTLREATTWAQMIGGTNDESCAALAMDVESSTYIVGTYKFGSVLSFPTTSPDAGVTILPVVAGTSETRMFLAKLDSNNRWAWAKDFGGEGQAIQPDAMIVVGTDVVVAGRIGGNPHSLKGFDPAPPAFVARFAGSTGDMDWLQGVDEGFQVDAGSDTSSAGVQVVGMAEAAGNILVVGNYAAAYTLGGIPLPKPSQGGAAFVAQLSGGTGKVIAARGYGDPAAANKSTGLGIQGLAAARSGVNGSLLLLGLSGQLNLGPPVGALQSVSAQFWDSTLVTLAP
jgi:hypothetical protein